jgi:hypothetical protein
MVIDDFSVSIYSLSKLAIPPPGHTSPALDLTMVED